MSKGYIRGGVQYMSEVEYYRCVRERIEEDNKTRVDHVDLVYSTDNSWTDWYIVDPKTKFYIRAYKFTPSLNPIVEIQTPLSDRDEPFQMSYKQFLAVVNCMKHTKGQGPISKLGASYELYITCSPEAILVEKYGGPHAYEQLIVPRHLCDSLEKEGEVGFMNLALFQADIINHVKDGCSSDEEESL